MSKQDIIELVEQLKFKENLDIIAEGFKAQIMSYIIISVICLIISTILIYILYRSYKKETDFMDTITDNPGIAITYICIMILSGGGGIWGLISEIPKLVLWNTSPLAALIKILGGVI